MKPAKNVKYSAKNDKAKSDTEAGGKKAKPKPSKSLKSKGRATY